MKRIFLIISILLLLGILYIAFMNTSNPVNINVLYSNMLDAQTKAGWSEQGAYFYKTMSLSAYTLSLIHISEPTRR